MSHADRTKIELEARKADVEEITRLRLLLERTEEVLRLCDGEDVRINGCTCTVESKCYLHGVIVAEALAVGGDPE